MWDFRTLKEPNVRSQVNDMCNISLVTGEVWDLNTMWELFVCMRGFLCLNGVPVQLALIINIIATYAPGIKQKATSACIASPLWNGWIWNFENKPLFRISDPRLRLPIHRQKWIGEKVFFLLSFCLPTSTKQECQMIYFQTKNPNFGKILKGG
jgi:hypothetical protein